MLSWIPLLGPILQGLFSLVTGIYSKFKDTQLGMRVQEVEEAKVSAQIIATTNDDICLRMMRDAACLPVVVWTMLIGWDTIISSHYKAWMWHVNPYPDKVGYLPYVVLVFLFGNIGLNMWNRK
jgi:hypothetical protein